MCAWLSCEHKPSPLQVRSSTASARRSTGTPCPLPQGAAPRAWHRSPRSPPPPSLQPPRLTWQTSQPPPSPKLRPHPRGLWIRARTSVLLQWHPRPPPQTAPSVHLQVSAGEPRSQRTRPGHFGNGVPCPLPPGCSSCRNPVPSVLQHDIQ